MNKKKIKLEIVSKNTIAFFIVLFIFVIFHRFVSFFLSISSFHLKHWSSWLPRLGLFWSREGRLVSLKTYNNNYATLLNHKPLFAWFCLSILSICYLKWNFPFFVHWLIIKSMQFLIRKTSFRIFPSTKTVLNLSVIVDFENKSGRVTLSQNFKLIFCIFTKHFINIVNSISFDSLHITSLYYTLNSKEKPPLKSKEKNIIFDSNSIKHANRIIEWNQFS